MNSSRNVLSIFRDLVAKGPVLRSHVYDPQLLVNVDVFECSVNNKTRLPVDVPFGMLAEVINGGQRANANQSTLRVRHYPDAATTGFPAREFDVRHLNEYVLKATKTVQVVKADNGVGARATASIVFGGGLASGETVTIGSRVYTSTGILTPSAPDFNVSPEGLYSSINGLYGGGADPLVEATGFDATTVYIRALAYEEAGNDIVLSTSSAALEINAFSGGADPGRARADSDADVWDSVITDIDEVHSLKTTHRVVTGLNKTEDVWDPALNDYITVTKELVNTRGSDSFGLGTNVYYTIVKDGWWIKTSEVYGTTTRSWTTVVDYTWPPVLNSFEPRPYVLKDGTVRYYPVWIWLREAYRGPCKATVEVSFSLTAPAVVAPVGMVMTDINYNCPFFQISSGPCLHGAITITADTSSSDPVWQANTGSSITYSATAYTDWPTTLVIDDHITEYKGIYRRQKVTIERPV